MNALPDSLVRYETELRHAIGRDRRRARRRLATRAAVAGLAAAALSLGVLGSLPGNDQSAVARAAAVLRADSGSILHFELVGRQTNPDGVVVTWHDERWQLTSPPYTMRQAGIGAGGSHAEIATVGSRSQLYDAATNTIYTGSPARAKTHDPTGKANTSTSGVPKDKAKLSHATDLKTHPAARGRTNRNVQPGDDPFRAKIAALLAAGEAHEDGHVTIDRRDAIRLVLGDGTIYLVDASTYAPIEWRSTRDSGTTTLTFPVYEKLPATAANEAQLSLRAQHPSAAVDADPADFEAAQARLFPRG